MKLREALLRAVDSLGDEACGPTIRASVRLLAERRWSKEKLDRELARMEREGLLTSVPERGIWFYRMAPAGRQARWKLEKLEWRGLARSISALKGGGR